MRWRRFSVPATMVAAACLGGILGVLFTAVEVLHADSQDAPSFGPAFERFLDDVPTYPGAQFFPLGSGMQVDSQTRQMGYAVTNDGLDKVADRYEGVWSSRGYFVRRRQSEREAWIIASDPTDPEVRSVVATVGDDGRTTIIASVSNRHEQVAQTVPVPERCVVVSSTAAVDRGVMTEIIFVSCDAPLHDVIDFYDGKLSTTTRRAFVDPTAARPDAHIQYSGKALHVGVLLTRVSTPQGTPAGSPEGADTGEARTTGTITWQSGLSASDTGFGG